MDENKLFLRGIEEKYDKFSYQNTQLRTDFMSPEQQSMLSGFLRAHSGQGIFLFGGYPEAERKLLLFMPEYTEVRDEDEAIEYFKTVPEDWPMRILKCTIPKQEKAALGHRDYLGALMGLGIKREKIGDILVRPDGADILVISEMADYMERELSQVGRVSLRVEQESPEALAMAEAKRELLRLNVASPRLDNVLSAVFSISRKSATEAISGGLVFVNGVLATKADFQLKGGEKLVLRRKGKALYLGRTGTSKKGKAYIDVEKYI